MTIWNKNDCEPEYFTYVVFRYNKSFDVCEDQDPYYKSLYYEDNDYSRDMLKQCDEWCYLLDLIQCSEDIKTMVDVFLNKNPEFLGWIEKNFDYVIR